MCYLLLSASVDTLTETKDKKIANVSNFKIKQYRKLLQTVFSYATRNNKLTIWSIFKLKEKIGRQIKI